MEASDGISRVAPGYTLPDGATAVAYRAEETETLTDIARAAGIDLDDLRAEVAAEVWQARLRARLQRDHDEVLAGKGDIGARRRLELALIA